MEIDPNDLTNKSECDKGCWRNNSNPAMFRHPHITNEKNRANCKYTCRDTRCQMQSALDKERQRQLGCRFIIILFAHVCGRTAQGRLVTFVSVCVLYVLCCVCVCVRAQLGAFLAAQCIFYVEDKLGLLIHEHDYDLTKMCGRN